jgi:predicted nucleic acid-binding protein
LWPRIKNLHANLSACDAQYVALAEALGVSLITADARYRPQPMKLACWV